jgi:hypothetical protein
LREAEQAGKLFRFVPDYDSDESEVRELWMSAGVNNLLYQKDRRKDSDFQRDARGFLKQFVIGGSIDNEFYMKSWRDDVFAFRLQLRKRGEPENTRIFGGFIEQDKFVALTYGERNLFDKGEGQWDKCIDKAADAWVVLFPDRTRIKARPFAGCVSSNFRDRYFSTLEESK